MSDIYELNIPWNNNSELEALALVDHPKALAMLWIRAYANNLSGYEYGNYDDDEDEEDQDLGSYYSISAEELIETALGNLNKSENEWNDYISKGGMLEGVGVDPTFWNKLSILCDREVPSNDRNNFFSCSC